ncbi:MAG: ornithine carbamoyltransferase [Chloroflexi bacterium]|nr:ornithine carbamoyltransferase [Chloroflexota bacterium]
MKGKDFLSIADLTPEEVSLMVQKAVAMKKGQVQRPLEGKIFALIFEKPSLRTRVSFEVGIRQLGGDCIYLSKDDIGLGVREPESDIARVLDRLVDGIIARVFSHRSLEILGQNTSIPVINALSDLGHPCQAIGDVLTIYEHKGSLEGLNVSFVGDGNNIAGSLALACASLGANFTLASPKGYQIPTMVWEEAKKRASEKESSVKWVEQPEEAMQEADVVYTDVWVSMGQEDEKAERLKVFSSYQIDEKLMDRAKPDAVFMHDMPAHRGEEVSENMLDHPNSVVFDQAENRLHAQKAILAHLFSE